LLPKRPNLVVQSSDLAVSTNIVHLKGVAENARNDRQRDKGQRENAKGAAAQL